MYELYEFPNEAANHDGEWQDAHVGTNYVGSFERFEDAVAAADNPESFYTIYCNGNPIAWRNPEVFQSDLLTFR